MKAEGKGVPAWTTECSLDCVGAGGVTGEREGNRGRGEREGEEEEEEKEILKRRRIRAILMFQIYRHRSLSILKWFV